MVEFRIKKAATSFLRQFLTRSSVLLNTQLWKLIASFLMHAVGFYINHDKEKKDIQILFKQHFSEDELT